MHNLQSHADTKHFVTILLEDVFYQSLKPKRKYYFFNQALRASLLPFVA